LDRGEMNTKAGTYNNFFNKDGVPKSKIRHKTQSNYTLKYHKNKIKDLEIKEKFNRIKKQIKQKYPSIEENYTKNFITYWNLNQCLYAVAPRRETLSFAIHGKHNFQEHKTYFEPKRGKTFIKIMFHPFFK
ncbi:MAG: hypothetical protein L6425_13340, partial [Candidatus Aminicenantes bacterium]|nr:hypothetical protein [Candidatus Aminicenantes bacterium]